MLHSRLHPRLLPSTVQDLLSYNSWCLKTSVSRTTPILSFLSRPTFLRTSKPASHVRHATHKAQGTVSQARDGPGKRLGAKKTGEQYVIPGNIIYRQRGTLWFPGLNVGMGRDHTIYALQHGYVKYYRDPHTHPKRKYIGVVFERHHTLPHPPHAARRRRLGMTAVSMEEPPAALESPDEASPASKDGPARPARRQAKAKIQRDFALRPGYMYREANWEIGRAAERAGVEREAYKSRDRFAAWRKTAARKARNAERRGMGGGKGGKGR